MRRICRTTQDYTGLWRTFPGAVNENLRRKEIKQLHKVLDGKWAMEERKDEQQKKDKCVCVCEGGVLHV